LPERKVAPTFVPEMSQVRNPAMINVPLRLVARSVSQLLASGSASAKPKALNAG
jgi:hypothetical protein